MRSRASQAYSSGPDIDAAMREYAPLVRRIAFQIASRLPAHIEVDDLVQEGMTGLLDALGRYKPQPNLSFEVYARTRIRGAIYDACRRNDILPRHQRDRINHVETAARALEQKLGRPPEDAEIAAEAGISIDEYFGVLDSAVNLSAIDDLPEDAIPADPNSDPMQLASLRQIAGKLETLLKKLPEKERLVVALHYQEDLSYREIAYVLDLTPGRISQLHTQAMIRLRGAMAKGD